MFFSECSNEKIIKIGQIFDKVIAAIKVSRLMPHMYSFSLADYCIWFDECACGRRLVIIGCENYDCVVTHVLSLACIHAYMYLQ